ncbi:hypothetical protein E2320_003615 [Naja naja]|nr:hypothetical protein E2320_003615 [Naja naja]
MTHLKNMSKNLTVVLIKDIILKEEQNPVEQQKPNDVPGIWFAVKTAPTVFPLSPCNQDIATTSQVSIGCLVKGYFPEPATVQWNSGAITSGIHNFPPVLLGSNHYTHSSLLTIPVSQWQSQSFQCNVHHAATDTRINKIIDRESSKALQSVVLWAPRSKCPIPHAIPEMVSYSCCAGLQISTPNNWTLSGRWAAALDCYIHTIILLGRILAHILSVPPASSMSPKVTGREEMFITAVTHAASQTKVKGKLKKCEGGSSCPSGNVNVYLVPPTPRALYIDRNSKISCVVNNLQNEQGLKITWSREKNGHLNVDETEVVEEPNGTYTGVRHLNVIAQDWESGESFTCTVEHPSFVSPVIKNIFKTRGNKKAPKVYVFPPHRDELNPGRSLSLVCMANGFYPEDIDIQWLQDHNPVSEDQYVTTPAMKNKHDDSFFAMSKLSISRDDWNERAFTCMVVHEELPMKFTQRNISKPRVKMNQLLHCNPS